MSIESFHPGLNKELIRPVVPTLVIAGRIGSGKGTMSDFIQEQYGFSHHTASDVLKRELAAKGFAPPYNRDQLERTSLRLRNEDNLFVVRRMLGSIAEEQKSGPKAGAIIEGLRYFDLVESLVQFPNVALCWIETDLDTRFDRAVIRSKVGDSSIKGEFVARDDIEAATLNDVKLLAEKRGRVIQNKGSEDEFKERIKSFMSATFPKV